MTPNAFFYTAVLALGSFVVLGGCTMQSVPDSRPASSSSAPKPASYKPAAQLKPAIQPVPARKGITKPIGSSVEGRPIEAIEFAGSSNTKPILIFAGIHGDERSTVAVARRLVDVLRESPDADRPTVVLIPLANPDGYEHRTRTNARGVDLNRNFPAENFKASSRGRYANGSAPLSEPESRALHDLVSRLKPARILTIHSIRPPRHGNNFDGPAESLAKLMASKNGYAVLPTMGYATPGSFGSWAGVDQQIPTITLELPSNAPAERAWSENRDALLAFILGR